MIKSVEGILSDKEPARATVKVGGVGLAVNIPLSTYSALPEIGSAVSLFTHLYIREDQLKLYGFATGAECSLFELLIGVNKVGPAVALQVLSSCKVEEFRRMVAAGDISTLASMVKGVGRKTAERMVLELKDKIDHGASEDPVLRGSPVAPDAVKALMQLGSSASDARREVMKAIEQTGAGASVDEILRTVFHNR